MSEASDKSGSTANVRSLSDALRRVRIAQAERSDVVVELREAERARLDMLAEELKAVFAEVPASDDQFIFSVSPGNQPRLWIDMTSFVALGRDRRTYRFLKDTRLGRTIISETADIDDMADTVTEYVAERIIERERALEGDWVAARRAADGGTAETAGPLRSPRSGRRLPFDRAQLGWIVAAALLGALLGVVALLAFAWVSIGPV